MAPMRDDSGLRYRALCPDVTVAPRACRSTEQSRAAIGLPVPRATMASTNRTSDAKIHPRARGWRRQPRNSVVLFVVRFKNRAKNCE